MRKCITLAFLYCCSLLLLGACDDSKEKVDGDEESSYFLKVAEMGEIRDLYILDKTDRMSQVWTLKAIDKTTLEVGRSFLSFAKGASAFKASVEYLSDSELVIHVDAKENPTVSTMDQKDIMLRIPDMIVGKEYFLKCASDGSSQMSFIFTEDLNTVKVTDTKQEPVDPDGGVAVGDLIIPESTFAYTDCLNQLKATQVNNKPCIVAKATDETTLVVGVFNMMLNCAVEHIEVSVERSESHVIHLITKLDSTDANCVCPRNLFYKITGLQVGQSYTIYIMLENSQYACMEVVFTKDLVQQQILE